MREPNEVGGPVIGDDAVEVVALEGMAVFIEGSRTKPSQGDGDVDEDGAVVLPEFEIELLSPAVGFAARIVGESGFERIEHMPAEGKDPSVSGAIEGSMCRVLKWNESDLCSVG